MKRSILVRPMTAADTLGVYRTSSEAIPATAEEREQVMNRSAEEVERRKDRYLHFLEHDPEGAWEGSPAIVAATTPEIATDLLWFCLAQSPGEAVEARWITGAQNWAIPVVLQAGLPLSPAGPICIRGYLGLLTPYLPSGPFL